MNIYIESFFIIVLEMLCCKMLFEIYWKKKKSFTKNISIIVILTFYTYAISFFLKDLFWVKQLCIVFGIAAIMKIYLKIKLYKSICMSLLFQGILIAMDTISLYACIILFPELSSINEIHGIEENLIIVIGKVLLFIIIVVLKEKTSDTDADMLTDSEWLRFMIFPLFSLGIISIMMIILAENELHDEKDLFFVIAISMAFMNFIVFNLINDILERESKLSKSKEFEIKVKNQTDMYRTMSEHLDVQRKKTHEYKNQLMLIENLIESKEYDTINKLIFNITGKLGKEMDTINTNNIIVNAILNSKYREIVEKEITFVFKINDLSDIELSDEDVVIILANLLNNAIEACDKVEEDRIIKLKFIKENFNIIISVINSYCGDLNIENNQLLTSKEDKAEHGMGIKNIVDVVEKYGGSYSYGDKNGKFYFSIVIPNKLLN